MGLQPEWRVERTDGTALTAVGCEGWKRLFTHADVVESGRVRRVEYGDLMVDLAADDTLILFVRHCNAYGHNSPDPDQLFLGALHADGTKTLVSGG